MGTFDPATFLDVNVMEANDITSTPVPVGEYTSVASLPANPIRNGIDKNGNPWCALDVNWEIDGAAYPQVKKETGRDKNSVKQSFFLETNEAGGLDTGKGKNVNLGRLREALGLNTPGKPFSFRQIDGQVAKVRVEHRIYEGQAFADVKAVTKA